MFRRILFLTLGVLECLAAIVLLGFGWGMPGPGEVHDGVSRIEKVTAQTSGQVARLREELHTVRQQRPKLRAMAENLRKQMELATACLQDQDLDYGAAQSAARAMGDSARGLDDLSDEIQLDGVHRMADDFKGTADQLDACTAALGSDAQQLARLLRQAQKGLEEAATRWPELHRTLTESARLLRAAQEQMQSALAHRAEYEKAMNQVIFLAKTYSAALPLMTEQMDEHLRAQEESLQDLGDSIDHTAALLPEWDRSATRVLETTRLLLFLMGAIFGIHGTYLTVGAWGRRRRTA